MQSYQEGYWLHSIARLSPNLMDNLPIMNTLYCFCMINHDIRPDRLFHVVLFVTCEGF